MRIGLLFPGQGFQRAGILAERIKLFPQIVNPLVEEVDSVLPKLRLSRALVDPNFEGDLTPTYIAQPLILAASYAINKTLEPTGTVEMAMGHSLGEISALACSGVLEFADALNLVHERGQAMNNAAKSGTGMTVLVKPRRFKGDWVALLQEVAEKHKVCIANYNALGQTVVSGGKQDLESMVAELKSTLSGLVAQELKVSGAFHSPYMIPAQPVLESLVKDLEMKSPAYPIVSNKTALPFESVDEIRASIPEMLVTPVKWQQSTAYASNHVDKFISVGPGRIGKMTAREYPVETEFFE